jgi:hypothetical protein
MVLGSGAMFAAVTIASAGVPVLFCGVLRVVLLYFHVL